jgi:hypothetical protein
VSPFTICFTNVFGRLLGIMELPLRLEEDKDEQHSSYTEKELTYFPGIGSKEDLEYGRKVTTKKLFKSRFDRFMNKAIKIKCEATLEYLINEYNKAGAQTQCAGREERRVGKELIKNKNVTDEFEKKEIVDEEASEALDSRLCIIEKNFLLKTQLDLLNSKQCYLKIEIDKVCNELEGCECRLEENERQVKINARFLKYIEDLENKTEPELEIEFRKRKRART